MTEPVTVPALIALKAAEIILIFASTLSCDTWNNRAVAPFPAPLINPIVTNPTVDKPAVATAAAVLPANAADIFPDIVPIFLVTHCVTFDKNPFRPF